jgi:photosynthetic reaction center cytochrome c subunit
MKLKWLLPLAFGAVALVVVAQIFAFATNVLVRSEHPPVGTVQRGYRGTGMVYLYNPRTMEGLSEANQVPGSVPYASEEGEKAGTYYKNLKVLGDVSVGEFTRLMVNMTTWVAPEQGCAACHNVADFAEDSLYTKVVARRMLEMTRHINADWTPHVARTGVTCYTCHRGRLVPPNVWFGNPGPKQSDVFAQGPVGQNHPTPALVGGRSSLPLDPFTPFLAGDTEIRVQSKTALRADNRNSIKQTEWTYALMMHFSQALGVN